MMRYVTLITFILITFGTTNALATTYYVKANGNNSADGKSHATAWRTIAKVNSFSFKSGDDVYFLAGNTWSNTVLKIDWDGTSSNRVIIGSYYINNGSETIVTNGDKKSIIRGTYDKAGEIIGGTGAVPKTRYTALLRIDGDYVTVQNISIKFSAGEGLDVLNLKNGRANHHHAIIENIEVYYTAGACTVLERNTHHNIVRNNEFHGCAWGWRNKDMITTGWPACNAASKSNHNLYENNFIHECFGEGVALINSDYNIVRSNTLASIRSAGIYSDNSQYNVVEQNIIIGDPTSPKVYFNAAAPGHSGGLAVVVEDYGGTGTDSIGNIYRNNLMAYVSTCISIGVEKKAKEAGRLVGGDFYGNTCIHPYRYSISINIPAANVATTNIKNNIISDPADTATSICRAPTDSDIVFSNNAWESRPTDNDCIGTADVYGKPTYTKSDWTDITPSNIPEADDFTLQDGSVGKNAAATLRQQILTISDYPLHKELSYPCKEFDSNGLTFDFNCKSRTSNSDIGAIDSRALQTPTGLSLTLK